MAKKKSKKLASKKNKIINILLLTFIIAVIIYAFYTTIKLVIVPTDICVVENGRISEEESVIGYIIRDEKLVKGNNNENDIVQIKSEAEKVAKGESIFRYSSSDEENITAKIDELNNKIQEAMLGQNDLFSGDIKAIQNQIENKIDGLKSKNNIQEIAEYKKDIDTYITKKSKIAGELSQAGSYINNLIVERDNYQLKLKQNSEYIKAPISGVISYRIDNLEEVLTPNNFDTLNKDFFNSLNLKTGQIITTSNQLGKVINNYECYIATIMESEQAREATIEQKVKLRLSTQDEVYATIEHIVKQDDKSVLIIFKICDCVEKLIDYRKISFDVIWWDFKGLKIPKSAIAYDNGLSYVIRSRGGYYNKILVQILKETKNYCIVSNYDDSDLKTLGYNSDEIYLMKKISIYDEIVVNPNLEIIE